LAEINLRIPGPTPCREEVLEAVARPMMNYRGPEMAELMKELTGNLKRFLDTSRDVLLVTASGTGGLEATMANTISSGDRVLGVNAGVFGRRFCDVAEAFGASLQTIEVEEGRALDPETLKHALHEEKNCRAVLLTHNETSTAVAHPIEDLCRVVREESDALVFVDAVSSLGAMPLPIDELGIDVVISGSQKAWGVPPGMVMLALSEKAWKATERATSPRFYFDLRRYRDAQARGSFPFTPALPVIYGLSVALGFMLRETSDGIFARHARIAEIAREGVRSLGLELFADLAHASSTVTAMKVPAGIDESALVALLHTRYDTVYARGQEGLRGKILRLGHLGWVQEPEIELALRALRRALADLGHRI